MKTLPAIVLAISLFITGCYLKGRKVTLKDTCVGIVTEIEYDRLKLTEPRKYWFELQEMIAFRHAFVLLAGSSARILKAEDGKALIEVKVDGKIMELWLDTKHIQQYAPAN